MSRYLRLSIGLAVGSFCLVVAGCTFAQTDGATAPQPEVVLVKLVGPVYPPLARQARIQGDVKLYVHMHADGSVASVELIGGHPLLAPAAVESAKNSEFECRGCTDEMSYPLTYTFGFIEDLTHYYKFEERPVRAAKCLYLWKCGVMRVNTFDPCVTPVPPHITQSPGHVKILAGSVCIMTQSSTLASRLI